MRTPILVVGATLALALAPSAGQGADSKTPCQKLKTNGHDLAPAKKVKLVERQNLDDGKDLKGCVLPDGKVREVAASAHFETAEYDYDVKQVKGAIVLLHVTDSSEFTTTAGESVFNIRSGRSYKIWEYCVGAACNPNDPGQTGKRAFVNSKGQTAAAIEDDGFMTIVGYSSKGERSLLDSEEVGGDIPKKSLELDGRKVTWKHDGVKKSATLSG